jgi:hypothetical protein
VAGVNAITTARATPAKKEAIMRIRSFTLAALGAMALLGSTLPAFAQDWRRDRAWREQEWREHHYYRPGYYTPPVVVAPPAYGYYAPPPAYYPGYAYHPGVSLGVTIR